MDLYIYTDEEIIELLKAYAETQCNKCAIRDLRRFCGSCYINAIKQAPDLISRQKAEIERLQKHNTEVAFKHYNDGKKAVLSTIFADITKEIGTLLPLRAVRLVTGRSVGISFELGRKKGVNDVIQCLAKVEKKYTEEAEAEVPEKAFFTPEKVARMSPDDVRKNYSAIMESMKEW